jgi:hypothetical protein
MILVLNALFVELFIPEDNIFLDPPANFSQLAWCERYDLFPSSAH